MSARGGLLLRAGRFQRAGGRTLVLHIRRVPKSTWGGLAYTQTPTGSNANLAPGADVLLVLQKLTSV